MGKILEFKNVYLELPDEYELSDEPENDTFLNETVGEENRATRMSLEELQQKLEETQSLHL